MPMNQFAALAPSRKWLAPLPARLFALASHPPPPPHTPQPHPPQGGAGLVPPEDVPRLAATQPASIRIPGAGDVDGRVRRIAPTVQPDSQLGQVFIAITTNRRLLVNSSGRALIKTGQSCGVSVPLTAVLYGTGGTVVQVVRRSRVETKRVEVGLMAG